MMPENGLQDIMIKNLVMISYQPSGVMNGLSGKEVRFVNTPKHKVELFVRLEIQK
jgi:hypothetical protein